MNAGLFLFSNDIYYFQMDFMVLMTFFVEYGSFQVKHLFFNATILVQRSRFCPEMV